MFRRTTRITSPALMIAIAVLGATSLGCSAATHDSGKAAAPDATGGTVIDFEKYAVGKTPTDFTTDLTGGGGAVSWIVQKDATAPAGKKVLAQTSTDDTDNRFPLCVYNDFSAKDVEASVRFKPLAGKVDQAGGLVVRFKDKNNYYIARANALENNVRLYKVVDGQRKQFAGVNTKVSPGEWHTLKLIATGPKFEVIFDGKSLFKADDGTFTDAGLVGLWTKADSVTSFDDLRFLSHDEK